MYLGHIVEFADAEDIYERPAHPYTVSLLSAVPVPTTEGKRQRIILAGDVPSPIDPPAACVFHPRCPRFKAGHCDVHEPQLEAAPGAGRPLSHLAACHYPVEGPSDALVRPGRPAATTLIPDDR